MKNAALFLWCTSSNVHHALHVMEAWDFEFKASAAWVKMSDAGHLQLGTGFVFRNAHEILLYGTRGNMPAPQYQPQSVLIYPRKRRGEKPEQIRKLIERMYPELVDEQKLGASYFRADRIKGWTCPWVRS